MMSLDDAELHHLWELRKATKERLDALEIQSASYGVGVPSHIAIDLERAKKDLELIRAKLLSVEPSADVTKAVGGSEMRIVLAEYQHKALSDKVGDGFAHFASQIELIREEAREYRTAERVERKDRQLTHDAEHARMYLDLHVMRTIVVITLIIVIISAALLFIRFG